MKYTLLFIFIFFAFQINSLAQLLTPNLADYDELRREVRAAFARGKERTADAVERERVQTYWEVGKLIDEHILLHKERAEYGKEVMQRLAVDLGRSVSEIYYIVEFARAYPNLQPARNLSWSHYQELLRINDPQEREKLAQEAEDQKWTRDRLREEIKKIKSGKSETVSEELNEEPLIPIKGSLDVYRLVNARSGQWKGTPVIDLGFSNYLELPKKYRRKFKAGDIVHSKGGKIELAKNATIGDLFTYRGYVLDITDGDTIWVWIDLGFGISTTQQLRLRGIDTPEIVTRDGQAAKEFVLKELSFPHALSGNPKLGSPTRTFGDDLPSIIVTTSKSDKYDRYLADIFYTPARDIKISAGSTRAPKHGYETKTGERYLNNRLLEKNFAARV